ncbi:MAG: methyltransferase domain-containing protein [Candidatus Omnitrophica bacterium]|nr:methyltransferase domain-containing protein [Candidatus Omnitrophota bacterium]
MATACCIPKVEEALLKVKGVKKVSACFKSGLAKVEIESGQVTTEQLIEAVKIAGFKAKVAEMGAEQIKGKFEAEFRELSKQYNIPQKDLEEHWNIVKKEAEEIYERCCKWSLSRGMEINDAETYCKSAIFQGMGEPALAEQIFKKKVGMLTNDEVKDLVKYRYGKFAEKYAAAGNPCPIRKEQVAGLYSEQELSLVSKTAHNLALGCGNPVNFAELKPGEVVVDLGCGSGIDVILAAHKVGPRGRVIGVDIAPQMIEKAKQAVTEARLQDRKIEFYVQDIEKLKLPDSLADVAISNCVIVLCLNKDLAYKEAFRILKSGGRIAISDIVFAESISPKIKKRLQSTWAGILGGAIEEKDYLKIVKESGFKRIEIVKRYFLTPEEVTAMSVCPGMEFTPAPDEKDIEAVQGKVVSIKFTAIKP